MPSIEEEIASCEILLMEEESAREAALSLSRELLRTARRAVNLIVRGDAQAGSAELESGLEKLRNFLNNNLNKENKCTVLRALSQAIQELAEGLALADIVEGRVVHRPEEIPPREFLLGLADAAGELRRIALNLLMTGDVDGARDVLSIMTRIFEGLSPITLPDSIVPLKRKVDALRALIDRTSSEVLFREMISSGGDRS